MSVPLWRGPTEGRVRILSPYRLRATRVAHLFGAGLQDGSSRRRRRRSAARPRAAAGARAPGAAATRPAEERYLFHACVSQPEQRLYLSYQAADDEGGEAPRSPFVDEVCDPRPGPTRWPARTR